MNKTSLGIITLFIFLTLTTIGGIKSEMDNPDNSLDIGLINFPTSHLEREGHRQTGESREEIKEAKEANEVIQGRVKFGEEIVGKVSWYERCFGTCHTANGDWFDPEEMTTACDRKYLGRYLRVVYQENSVIVFCNDTGNFDLCLREPEHPKCKDPKFREAHSRVLDLSRGAFRKLAPLSKGVITARIEVI